MFRRWVQVEAGQHQGLGVFVADLGLTRAQLVHESLRGHLEGSIVHL
jgi:hypothetical protein